MPVGEAVDGVEGGEDRADRKVGGAEAEGMVINCRRDYVLDIYTQVLNTTKWEIRWGVPTNVKDAEHILATLLSPQSNDTVGLRVGWRPKEYLHEPIFIFDYACAAGSG